MLNILFFIQLDDWVLCRVRKKSGMLRNTREEHRNGPSYINEPAATAYFQPVLEDQPQSMNMNPNPFAAVRNYLYNDSPMLPYIFAASHEISSNSMQNATSSISFPISSSINGTSCPSSFHEDYTNIINSSSSNFLSPLKRIISLEGYQEIRDDGFFPPTKKVISHKSDDHSMGIVKFCGTDHIQDTNLEADQWSSSLVQYQEFENDLVFTHCEQGNIYGEKDM